LGLEALSPVYLRFQEGALRGNPGVEVNPKDAQRLGLADGEPVHVVSRRGRICARAWITERIPEGVVYAPFHFAEAPTNRLTHNALDPISRIPDYKVSAVRLEKTD
jgi:anaerobic selenocysteine-containing dehydrogenase